MHRVSLLVSSAVLLAATTTATAVPTYHVLGEGFGIAGLLTYDSLTDLVNGSPSNNQLVSGSFGDAIGLVAVEGQTNGNNNNAIPEPVTAALGLMGLGV